VSLAQPEVEFFWYPHASDRPAPPQFLCDRPFEPASQDSTCACPLVASAPTGRVS
jgi:hypothetical protein